MITVESLFVSEAESEQTASGRFTPVVDDVLALSLARLTSGSCGRGTGRGIEAQ